MVKQVYLQISRTYKGVKMIDKLKRLREISMAEFGVVSMTRSEALGLFGDIERYIEKTQILETKLKAQELVTKKKIEEAIAPLQKKLDLYELKQNLSPEAVMNGYIKLIEASERYDYGVEHLRNLIKRGEVLGVMFGKTYYINVKSLELYLDEKGRGPYVLKWRD